MRGVLRVYPSPMDVSTTIAIGLITAGDIRVEYAQSLIETWRNDITSDWIVIPSGPYLDVGRNKIVDQFFAMNDARIAEDLEQYHGLLMTDSDMQWKHTDVSTIVDLAAAYFEEHGVWPVLGGAYLGVQPGGSFVVSYDFDDDRSHGLSMSPIDPDGICGPNAPELIPVKGTGTGFMYIPRLVLEHFREFYDPPMIWFQDLIVDGGWFGEDLMFCIRAESIGHPTFLCRDVRLGHYKTQGLIFPPAPTPEES